MILSFSDRLEHTELLFIRLDILPFNKLIHYRIGLFMYKVYKDSYVPYRNYKHVFAQSEYSFPQY